MMPERPANSDPFKALTEVVGSGPFHYTADERVPGALDVYRKFEGYIRRPDDTPAGWTAGPKLVHFDCVEWAYVLDPATVTNAAINGEAAWQEYAYADWPTSPRIEALRTALPSAPDLATQQAICRDSQTKAFEDTPSDPIGAFSAHGQSA